MYSVDEIQAAVAREVDNIGVFNNFHGITIENLRQFLVRPYEVVVDPDDLVSPPQRMWVVLQETGDARRGSIIVYDAETRRWGVAEAAGSDDFVLLCGADSLTEALKSM